MNCLTRRVFDCQFSATLVIMHVKQQVKLMLEEHRFAKEASVTDPISKIIISHPS